MIILFYGNFALNIQKLCSLYSCKSLLASALLLFWEKKLDYAIMQHVMAFKLWFVCQSPGHLHLSQPYGVTFYCNSEMRWPELHSHMRKENHSQYLHPPPAIGQRVSRAFVSSGLFLLSDFFQFRSQFPLKLTFCDYSFHFTFTPLSTQVQNTNPF